MHLRWSHRRSDGPHRVCDVVWLRWVLNPDRQAIRPCPVLLTPPRLAGSPRVQTQGPHGPSGIRKGNREVDRETGWKGRGGIERRVGNACRRCWHGGSNRSSMPKVLEMGPRKRPFVTTLMGWLANVPHAHNSKAQRYVSWIACKANNASTTRESFLRDREHPNATSVEGWKSRSLRRPTRSFQWRKAFLSGKGCLVIHSPFWHFESVSTCY